MRNEVTSLLALGRFPSSEAATVEQLQALENALERIPMPLQDDEAKSLVEMFGPDECFGLAWTLLHLIETAPNWPVHEALRDVSNE